MKTFLIIDAHALIHRAYHALPPLTSPDGRLVNAAYGFTSVLIRVLREFKPDYVAAAFDLAGPTFRHEAYELYKATRVKVENELIAQIPLVRAILTAFSIPILEHPDFEADDIIGTIVEDLKNEKNISVVIVTGDLDALQLVEGKRVVVYTLRRGIADTVIYDEARVRDRYGGLTPGQLADFKGLKGDPSDNIPGVPGVGEKTAGELLQKYPNLETLYESFESDEGVKAGVKARLRENKDQAFLSRELATIRRDAPIAFSLESVRYLFELKPELAALFEKVGFKSLLARLGKEKTFKNSSPIRTEIIEQPDGLEEYYKKGLFSKKIYELERSLTPALRRMEKTGIAVNIERLQKLSRDFKKELADIEKEAHHLAGEPFNLNSPQEVGQILFDKLLVSARIAKKTKTGQYSTTAAELEKLKDKHEIVPLILRWRELSKLTSTYLDALPRLVDPKDGRVHTTFNQFGAATGRLSSESPNLQNIPVKGEAGEAIRKAFVARKGFLILAADYSQIELRIAAALSGDPTMIETFKKGEDVHTRTAAEVFNVPFDRVSKDMRRTAKILNFGVLYGMGAASFAKAALIDRDRAGDFIDEYRADFAGLTKFLEELKEKAYAAGYAETIWGRRRPLPELASANPGIRAAGERMAINMPIQGTAADVIKAAMVKIDEKISGQRDVFLILQIHDELLFEVKKGQEEEWGREIKKIMEGVIDLVVPLEVNLEAGPSWGELKSVIS